MTYIYSDNIELDYVGFGGISSRNIEHKGIKNGHVSANVIFLESGNDTALFTDCPYMTIHAHRGSSAHLYANIHNIKFAAIREIIYILLHSYIKIRHRFFLQGFVNCLVVPILSQSFHDD